MRVMERMRVGGVGSGYIPVFLFTVDQLVSLVQVVRLLFWSTINITIYMEWGMCTTETEIPRREEKQNKSNDQLEQSENRVCVSLPRSLTR